MDEAAWIDLFGPTAEEEAAVEAAFKIDIPTREELAEIEASSRLYQEDGATFMTATLIRRGDDGKPETQPVTFIVKDDRLITVRYSEPRAFPIFIKRAQQARHLPAFGQRHSHQSPRDRRRSGRRPPGESQRDRRSGVARRLSCPGVEADVAAGSSRSACAASARRATSTPSCARAWFRSVGSSPSSSPSSRVPPR